MRIAQRFVPLGLLVILPCLGGWSSCEGSLNDDPSFDLWCGDRLCAWEQEAGSVRRVPTWHDRDSGVELVGDPSAISQPLDVTSAGVDCLRFEMMTSIEDGTMVTMELDFLDDGAVEVRYPVPATRWAAVEYQVTAPTWFEGLRLRLRKDGPGRAVLAHVRLTSDSGCSGAPVTLAERPLGVYCRQDQDCAEGRCTPGPFPFAWLDDLEGPRSTCGLCAADSDCQPGQVCGVEASPKGLYAGCGPGGRHALGERCLWDGECATGLCCDEMCSTCCAERAPCPAGRACARVPFEVPEALLPLYEYFGMPLIGTPFQCDPGAGHGEPGEACLADADCASGACQGRGSLRCCQQDNRPCSSEEDCLLPPWFEGDLACQELGVLDGRCL